MIAEIRGGPGRRAAIRCPPGDDGRTAIVPARTPAGGLSALHVADRVSAASPLVTFRCSSLSRGTQ